MFDFFNTLTVPLVARRSRRSYCVMAEEFGVSIEQVLGAFSDSRSLRLTGELGGTAASIQHIGGLVGALEIPQDRIRRIAEARRQEILAASALAADALPTIGALKRQGLKVGVISNCGAELVESWTSVPILPALLDVTVLSHVAGVCKPDPRIYQEACAAVGLSPAQVLFVGDGEDDEIAGAQRAGMRALRLRRGARQTADAQTRSSDVGSLAEVVFRVAGQTPRRQA